MFVIESDMNYDNVINFIRDNWLYIITFYLCVSAGGYYFMKNYIRDCFIRKVIPFGNSVFKMAVVSIVCGLFTTVVIILGIALTIVEILNKKS